MKNDFKVTVIIPTYNGLPTLPKAIDSVLQQCTPVCLHVLDNASTDGSTQWIQKIKSDSHQIKCTLRTENIGAAKNFADGFRQCETEYIVPLACDDYLLPGFIQQAVAIATSDPSLGSVVFQTEFHKNGKLSFVNPVIKESKKLNSKEHIQHWLKCGFYFSWSGILFNNDLMKECQADNEIERFSYGVDAWIQFLAFLSRPAYIVSKPGAVLNLHPAQASNNAKPEDVRQICLMVKEIERKVTESKIFSETELSAIYVRLYEYWCSVIEWLVLKSGSHYTDEQILDTFQIYISEIYPRWGFKFFPLLPLFKKYRENVNTSLVHKISWMENSLSWKISKPLRSMLTLLKEIGNS
jgi:glycosyltransferase involved in cell wall biosynthesis